MAESNSRPRLLRVQPLSGFVRFVHRTQFLQFLLESVAQRAFRPKLLQQILRLLECLRPDHTPLGEQSAETPLDFSFR